MTTHVAPTRHAPFRASADEAGNAPTGAGITPRRLTHLEQLEAESIHIIREVAAEFSNPVMLYSIGKDSSVMLRLAQKAFYPGPIPFPLLHVDTTYKFREMIQFRDEMARSVGARPRDCDRADPCCCGLCRKMGGARGRGLSACGERANRR